MAAAQIIGARHSRITGVATLGALIHRLQNAGVGSDVMLTDGEFGDILPSGYHSAGAIKHFPAVRAAGCDMCDAM